MDTPSKLTEFGESLTAFFRRSKPVAGVVPRLLVPQRFAYGQFGLQFQIAKGQVYDVQASPDLLTWTPVFTGTAPGETCEFLDTEAGKYTTRFYRVLSGELVSPNTIGFVSVTLAPGFSMISNPLNAHSNKISALFPDLREGTTFNKFDTTLFRLTKNSVQDGKWVNPEEVLNPGEGGLMQNPTSEFRKHTFVGEVLSGDLSLPIPAGFSIRSSLLPIPGRLDTDLQFPIANSDVIHLFDRDQQKYVIYTYQENAWTPGPPVVSAGESFWIGKTSAGNWVQTTLLQKGR